MNPKEISIKIGKYTFKIINYSPSLGICNWSSLYKFTDKNLLEEGNMVINNNFKCFNTIKIYLGKRSSWYTKDKSLKEDS